LNHLAEQRPAALGRQGRITIPKLIMNLLKEEEETLEGHVFKVMLTPP